LALQPRFNMFCNYTPLCKDIMKSERTGILQQSFFSMYTQVLFWSRKPRLTTGGIHCTDHATPSIRKSWHYFANKRRSLDRHSSLEDQSHEVFLYTGTLLPWIVYMSKLDQRPTVKEHEPSLGFTARF
jgi:hypothetical protein